MMVKDKRLQKIMKIMSWTHISDDGYHDGFDKGW